MIKAEPFGGRLAGNYVILGARIQLFVAFFALSGYGYHGAGLGRLGLGQVQPSPAKSWTKK